MTTDKKAAAIAAFWERASYTIPAPTDREWATKFASACDSAPKVSILVKLQADNMDSIRKVDDALYREVVEPAIAKAMGRLSQAPVGD